MFKKISAGIGAGVSENLYELVDNFADGMATIKRVIEFGQQQEFGEQERQENNGEHEQWHQPPNESEVGSKGYENRVPQGPEPL